MYDLCTYQLLHSLSSLLPGMYYTSTVYMELLIQHRSPVYNVGGSFFGFLIYFQSDISNMYNTYI